MPSTIVTAQMPVDVYQYTCDLPGCGAQITADHDLSTTGWYTMTISQLQGPTLNQAGALYFDSLAHATQWLQLQPKPVIVPVG